MRMEIEEDCRDQDPGGPGGSDPKRPKIVPKQCNRDFLVLRKWETHQLLYPYARKVGDQGNGMAARR
jgi:hypothetical protein